MSINHSHGYFRAIASCHPSVKNGIAICVKVLNKFLSFIEKYYEFRVWNQNKINNRFLAAIFDLFE